MDKLNDWVPKGWRERLAEMSKQCEETDQSLNNTKYVNEQQDIKDPKVKA